MKKVEVEVPDGYKLSVEIPEGYVLVKEKVFDEMEEDCDVLNALRLGGVDNWEWYDASLEDHLPD